ncbi:MAG: hypothetical protein WDZ59_09010 [Pirellulales bacterium]
MIAATALLAVATFGVDTGWEPLPDGGLVYIIQIEPQLLSAMREGTQIASEIPAELAGVRSYRILIGDGTLPREGLAPSSPDGEVRAGFRPPAAPPEPDTQQVDAETPLASPGDMEPGTFSADPNDPVRAVPASAAEPQQPHNTDKSRAGENAREEASGATGSDKPWLPVVLLTVGLCLSVGANLYLIWITWDTRRRYRTLARHHPSGA